MEGQACGWCMEWPTDLILFPPSPLLMLHLILPMFHLILPMLHHVDAVTAASGSSSPSWPSNHSVQPMTRTT